VRLGFGKKRWGKRFSDLFLPGLRTQGLEGPPHRVPEFFGRHRSNPGTFAKKIPVLSKKRKWEALFIGWKFKPLTSPYVFPRVTERGTVHVIRYRVRSADGKWRHKAETVNTPRRKDAERILAQRLREVNRSLRLPVEITFAEYAAGHWATYISQNLKPSIQASHRPNVKAHLLPMFGKRRLSEISPVHVMDLLKGKAAAGLKPKSLLNLYVLLQNQALSWITDARGHGRSEADAEFPLGARASDYE
jgi:hypothetical protein